MSNNNNQEQTRGSGNGSRHARPYYYPGPARRIDGTAPYAHPENNKGANPAGEEIRAGWGWGASPETASDEIKQGWGVGTPPDFLKKQDLGVTQAAAAVAKPGAQGAAGASVPQKQGKNQQSPAQGASAPQAGGNAAYNALTQAPFGNGRTLDPSSVTPGMVHQTGAGTYVDTDTPGGARSVAVTPSLDQVMHTRTNGQWQTWTPAQRSQYLRGQAVSPSQQTALAQGNADVPGTNVGGTSTAPPPARLADNPSFTIADGSGRAQTLGGSSPAFSVGSGANKLSFGSYDSSANYAAGGGANPSAAPGSSSGTPYVPRPTFLEKPQVGVSMQDGRGGSVEINNPSGNGAGT